jgi:hypothetical protein
LPQDFASCATSAEPADGACARQLASASHANP